MQFPITIGLHRSRFLDLALLGIVVALGATLLAFSTDLPFRLACLILTFLLAAQVWRRLSPRLSAVRLEKTGQLSVLPIGADEFLAATLLPVATVHPWLSIARLQTDDGRTFVLIVAPDSTDCQSFRRLRVFLRWRADFSVPGDDA